LTFLISRGHSNICDAWATAYTTLLASVAISPQTPAVASSSPAFLCFLPCYYLYTCRFHRVTHYTRTRFGGYVLPFPAAHTPPHRAHPTFLFQPPHYTRAPHLHTTPPPLHVLDGADARCLWLCVAFTFTVACSIQTGATLRFIYTPHHTPPLGHYAPTIFGGRYRAFRYRCLLPRCLSASRTWTSDGPRHLHAPTPHACIPPCACHAMAGWPSPCPTHF